MTSTIISQFLKEWQAIEREAQTMKQKSGTGKTKTPVPQKTGDFNGATSAQTT